MPRRTGYLANIFNLPPLIFRFQFNPDVLSDKKSYRYEPGPSMGLWRFDQTQAATGFIGTLAGFYKDVSEIGALLICTRPLEAREGEPRQITLEFQLDASRPGPLDGDDHYGGSILPDLAVLRSFLAPSYDLFDVIQAIASRDPGCFNRPPTCSVSYGHVSMVGVMTDLDIKVVAFQDDGSPLRAEVSATVKEQAFSHSPIVDTAMRLVYTGFSYTRKDFGRDIVDSQLPFLTGPIFGE